MIDVELNIEFEIGAVGGATATAAAAATIVGWHALVGQLLLTGHRALRVERQEARLEKLEFALVLID